MKVRATLDDLCASEGHVDASLCSAEVLAQWLVSADLSDLKSLDISHNDLCSPDGEIERAILIAQGEAVFAEVEIKEGQRKERESHKEKDFAVGAAKRREGKAQREKGEATLQEANDRLLQLRTEILAFPWSRIVPCALQSLKANNCGIQAANLQQVTSSTLRELSLDGNYFGDEGAAEIAEIIKRSASLEELSVRNTGLTDQGVSVILAAIVANTTLQLLDLRCNSLSTDASETAIKGMRHFNKTATVLF